MIWRVYPRRTVRLGLIIQNSVLTVSPPPDAHTLTEATSSALAHLNVGAGASSSNSNLPPAETPIAIGSALPCKATEGVQENTCEIETQVGLLSNAGHLAAAPQSQSQPESQEAPDRAISTPSTRLLGGATATTDSTSSGTSAAAETPPTSESSVSDRPGQQHALPLRERRVRPLEDIPAEDEAGSVVLSTQLMAVSPDRGPTTGGVRIIILGKNFPSGPLYARFGNALAWTVSEALRWLGTGLTGCWL